VWIGFAALYCADVSQGVYEQAESAVFGVKRRRGKDGWAVNLQPPSRFDVINNLDISLEYLRLLTLQDQRHVHNQPYCDNLRLERLFHG